MSIHSTVSSRTTTEQEVSPIRRFVRDFLPWVIAAVALVVYLATINRWVSFLNLYQVARVSGWTWQVNLTEPLYWLATYPLHWLPVKIIPIALNLFSVVCAVLTLALLARSVALLPHDRTLEQRQREHSEFALLSIPLSWLPPVMAVLVCGLQLTFWENATVGSNEILNLLVFAYVVRCLLEFRIDERESWLTRAALVYGLGMTNNWLMIAFLPLFLAALVWIRGLHFFNLRFLAQMLMCGSLGLLLYLALPFAQSHADILKVSFWRGFRVNVGGQFGTLATLYKMGRPTMALLALTSLVPVLVIGIKWASYFGDTSKIGVALATFMFHVSHAILFIACLWVTMDPPFGARFMGQPFLIFYYLGALSVGYFAGYFLLIFGEKTSRAWRVPAYIKWLNTAVKFAVWLLFLVVPIVLIARNLPQIRTTNGAMFKQMASLMMESVPSKGAILLSDDPRKLLLAQAILAQKGQEKDCIFIDAGPLNDHLVVEYPDYHRFLKKQHGNRWPVDLGKAINTFISPRIMIPLLSTLEKSNSLFYLHPSFGLYFEGFYLEPHGLAYRFKSYASTNLFPPSLSEELVTENEAFWAKADPQALRPLLPAIATSQDRHKQSWSFYFAKMAHLKNEPNRDAAIIGKFYSRALDYWGVELQKRGDLEKGAHRFKQALEMGPDNVAAEVNLQCNTRLQAHQATAVQLSRSVTELFGPYRTWNSVIGENGPFDEPSFCYEQGQLFIQNSLFRQAMYQFARVKELDRTHLQARLWLAQLYIMAKLPKEALQMVTDIEQNENLFSVNRTNVTELMFSQATTYLANNNTAGADAAIQKALQQFDTDKELLPRLLSAASRSYLNFGVFSNALPLIEQQLALSPDNMEALANKGYASLQLHLYEQAIPALSRLLQATNYPPARLNRAIAYLRSGQLDASQKDYESLQQANPNAYPVFYGLAEIAYLQKDTNAAIRYCELYLTNASPNSEEAKLISQRLAELRPR